MSNHDLTGLAEDEMLRAVYENEPCYDGLFFYGLTSTMIFCFPSCPSRKPRREHVRFFLNREEALSQGFRACKRCLSDLEGGRPQYEADLVARIKTLVDDELNSINTEQLATVVDLSPHYLMRVFRRVAGLSLHEFIRCRRAWKAAELLRESNQSILDVAAAVGFESMSAFYTVFDSTLGVPPGEYRQRFAMEASSHKHR